MSSFASINDPKVAQAGDDTPQKLVMEDLDFTKNDQKVVPADDIPQKLIVEDLDFTKPSQSVIYDPATALAFFRSAGANESVAQGVTFFVEQQKPDSRFLEDAKMYLLVEGEVKLVIGKQAIDILKPGEVFGEMALISGTRRSATAVAKTACRALSLKMSQLHEALSRTPEFALMLMSIMINRLRLTNARLSMKHALPAATKRPEGRVFEEATLAGLLNEARSISQTRLPPGKSIMTAGETGLCMYVVLEGSVAVSVQGKVVERVGPGGVFGEMALIDRSPRAASAVAETSCVLLPISRKDFLALISNKPSFAVALLKNLADRLRFMTSHIPSN